MTTLRSPFDFLYLTIKTKTVKSMSAPAMCNLSCGKRWTNAKRPKKKNDNWKLVSRESQGGVKKNRSRSPWSPFSPQPRLSARVSSAGPRLFWLRGHNLMCSLCVNRVPQCRLPVIGAVSVWALQRFSLPRQILDMALWRSIYSSVIPWTSHFKTHSLENA